jgi:hypothetical protein
MTDIERVMWLSGWSFDEATGGYTKRGVGWVSADQAAALVGSAMMGEDATVKPASRTVAEIVAKAVANE